MPVVDLKMLKYQEMQKLIKAMGVGVAADKTRKAGVRAMAIPLKRDLLASIPVDSGVLRSSIGYKMMTKRYKSYIGVADSDIAMEVGATRKVLDNHDKNAKKRRKRLQVYVLRFLNEGVAPHAINAKASKERYRKTGKYRNRSLFIGNKALGPRVMHPGFAGRHLSQKAYDKHKDQMDNYFVKGAAKQLERFGIRAVES